MRRMLLVVFPVAVALLAGCGEDSELTSLKGTWVGQGSGYNDGTFEERTARLVITETREDGNVFVGYKQTKADGEPYGPRETIQGGIGPDDTISIADEDGILFFEFSEGNLVGQYLESDKNDSTVKNYTLLPVR